MFQGVGYILQFTGIVLRTSRVLLTNIDFGRILDQLLFKLSDSRQLTAVSHHGHRCAKLPVGEPGHGYQESQQHNDVLRHLCPCDGTHAA